MPGIQQKANGAARHGVYVREHRAFEIPARDSGAWAVRFALFASCLKENPPFFLRFVGLPGGNCPFKIAVKLLHGQFTDGPQGRFVLFDAEDKIQIRVILKMGDRVVGFVPAVKDYNGGFTVFPPVNQSAQSALFIVGDATAYLILAHIAVYKSMV